MNKKEIISYIETWCRDGDALSSDVVEVLKKLSCADLLLLKKAFQETYQIGYSQGYGEGSYPEDL
jgi:hypothetical protein